MNFKWIWLRFNRMFLSPKAELETLRNETGAMGETYLFMAICCFFIGLSYITKGSYNLYSETLIWASTILITTFLTWIFAPKFGITTTWAKALKTIVFTVFPFLLMITIANIFGYRLQLLVVGIVYSTYLLYNALKIVFGTNFSKTTLYIIVIIMSTMAANYASRLLIP